MSRWHPNKRPALTLFAAKDSPQIVPLVHLLADTVAVSTASAVDEVPAACDLLLCLHLPTTGADEAVFARTLADRAERLILAPVVWNDDPALESEQIYRWLGAFAAAGMVYDVADASSLPAPLTWTWLLRRTNLAAVDRVGYLTLALHRAHRQLAVQQSLAAEQYDQLAAATHLLSDLQKQLIQSQERHRRLDQSLGEVSGDWSQLQNSPGFALLQQMQRARAHLAPPGSYREGVLEMGLGWLRIVRRRGLSGLVNHLRKELSWRANHLAAHFDNRRHYRTQVVEIPAIHQRPQPLPHHATVDIVICVHNALPDVERCLASVLRHTSQPYALILVDDGSAGPTRDFLAAFAQTQTNITLLRNEESVGYTLAANQGMRHSCADFILLLNSDTIVTQGWLDRMLACAESDALIGLVGPLSNTASWQSVPEVALGTDWAENPLPAGMDLERWAAHIRENAARLYPSMPLLNGFCLLIRRGLIDDIGLFDEEAFGAGYGEENDYALRARAAGWRLALADDVYIFHAQSRSYSDEKRKRLSDRAGLALATKHDANLIERSVAYCRDAPILHGIRARIALIAARTQTIAQGQRRFGGRRLLFLLPADGPGGGANVVITESRAMQKMDVDVALFNLADKRLDFEAAYPGLDLPVIYGDAADVTALAARYDAVVATWHSSVAWLHDQPAIPGYYVQDFEPRFFAPESVEYRLALESYTELPNLRLFTKTAWNQQQLLDQVGLHSAVVGPSLDIDRFCPRRRDGFDGAARPLSVVAMVRPSSARRSPAMTMRLLRRLSHRYGHQVEITIFGVAQRDPDWAALPQDFHWRLAGVLTPDQVATLLAQADIFADFSTYQAMGLTALEAMACGAAVIVPEEGGATSFARHEYNALVVDTADENACWAALVRLVEDAELRGWLRRRGIYDACRFYPEQAAYRILEVLLTTGGAP